MSIQILVLLSGAGLLVSGELVRRAVSGRQLERTLEGLRVLEQRMEIQTVTPPRNRAAASVRPIDSGSEEIPPRMDAA